MGLILQSILGGVASEFAAVEIQDWMFKFTVFSRDVGLMVYKLGVVTNPTCKLAFNLWNERGMHLANSFIVDATCTHHPCVQVLSKKISVLTLMLLRIPHLYRAQMQFLLVTHTIISVHLHLVA